MNWLNWEPVFEHIANTRLAVWNQEAVAVSVVKATEHWVLGQGRGLYGKGDMHKYNVLEVELYGEEPYRHKIDMLFQDKETAQLTVGDWKTKLAGKLDDKWELRETRSPQKRLYAAALAERYGMDIFPLRYEVRGIVLTEDKPQVKTLVSEITPGDAEAAVHYIRDVAAMRDTLRDQGHKRWPQHTSGCRMYGPNYACEYEDVCWNGVHPPEPGPDALDRLSKPMSHSKAQEFLRCPERARLIQITDVPVVDDEEDPASGPGTVFHKSMEIVLNQLRNYQKIVTVK